MKIPRQVLRELQANLRHEEMREFFRLLHRHAEQTDMRWEQVELSRIRTYQRLGCKLGDAAVAAHLDVLGVGTLVSENRDFLYEIRGLPFRVLRAADFLRELEEVELSCPAKSQSDPDFMKRFGLALLAYTDILLCSIWSFYRIRQTPVTLLDSSSLHLFFPKAFLLPIAPLRHQRQTRYVARHLRRYCPDAQQ